MTPALSSVPQNNEKLQESPCIFALTPRQVELIRNSRCAVSPPSLTCEVAGGVAGGPTRGPGRAFNQTQRKPCAW